MASAFGPLLSNIIDTLSTLGVAAGELGDMRKPREAALTRSSNQLAGLTDKAAVLLVPFLRESINILESAYGAERIRPMRDVVMRWIRGLPDRFKVEGRLTPTIRERIVHVLLGRWDTAEKKEVLHLLVRSIAAFKAGDADKGRKPCDRMLDRARKIPETEEDDLLREIDLGLSGVAEAQVRNRTGAGLYAVKTAAEVLATEKAKQTRRERSKSRHEAVMRLGQLLKERRLSEIRPLLGEEKYEALRRLRSALVQKALRTSPWQ